MSLAFDPLLSIALILLQVGNKYLKFDITKAQEKILVHPIAQLTMYSSVIYFTTRNFFLTAIIVFTSFLLLKILLNENHRYNLLPADWLYKEKLIKDRVASQKELYKDNMNKYHL